jgi:hypothetical protein
MTSEHVLLVIVDISGFPFRLVGSGSEELGHSAARLDNRNFCAGTLALPLSI